jgi:hypothetical protein
LRGFFCAGGVGFLLGFLRISVRARGKTRGEGEQECGVGVAEGWCLNQFNFSHFLWVYFWLPWRTA